MAKKHLNVTLTMLASYRGLSSYGARPQPRRRWKEDSSKEERRSRAYWRTPRIHVTEEPELRRAPSRPRVQDYAEMPRFAELLLVILPVLLVMKAELLFVLLTVLLVVKALENH